jgi:hypothetical protein
MGGGKVCGPKFAKRTKTNSRDFFSIWRRRCRESLSFFSLLSLSLLSFSWVEQTCLILGTYLSCFFPSH